MVHSMQPHSDTTMMTTSRLIYFMLFLLLLMFALVLTAGAQTPRTISYQGTLTASGAPASGSHLLHIALYDSLSGGQQLYQESQSTDVTNGVFNIEIGSVTPLPASLRFDHPYFLGVSVDGNPELTPRSALSSAPYSLSSHIAELAEGLTPDAHGVVTSINELAGALHITGDSITTITENGNTISIHAKAGTATGIQSIQSKDKTIGIANGTGPNVDVGVADNAITTAKLADGSVTPAKLAQAGATTGQILKWNGTAWTVANENAGGGGLANGSLLNSTLRWNGTAWVENTSVLETPTGGITGASLNISNTATLGDGTGVDNITLDPGLGQIMVKSFGQGIVKSSPSGVLSSGLVDLTTDITGILPVPHGGTGVNNIPAGQVLIGNGVNPITSAALTAGTGISITTAGGAITIANTGTGSAGWLLTGNSGTTVPTNFLGTTDAQPLEIHINNTDGAGHGSHRVMRYENNATSANLIGGYQSNAVTSGVVGSTIAGGGLNGFVNTITDDWGFIGGGSNNRAGDNTGSLQSAAYATVGGGGSNTASGQYSSVLGGTGNGASAIGTSVGGGSSNQASGAYATVTGGVGNVAGDSGAVVGGRGNVAGRYSFVGGGQNNSATGLYSTIGGGVNQFAFGTHATISGGFSDTIASAAEATIAGGYINRIYSNGAYSTIGGGEGNAISGPASTISGGSSNSIQNYSGYSTISGGFQNTAVSGAVAIPGGESLTLNTNSFGISVPATGATNGVTDLSSTQNIAYFGNMDLWLGNTNNTARGIRFYSPNTSLTYSGSNYSSFLAGSQSATINYTLPTSQPSANQVLTATAITGTGPYAVTLGWAAAGSGSAWNLTGNSGTIDGVNFLGTTDDVPLNFRVNNQRAGRIDSTLENTFLGYQSGQSNTTGNTDVLIGFQAGKSNTTGYWNTVVGAAALLDNTTGHSDDAFGNGALGSNTSGSGNVALGLGSLFWNTTGSGNTAVGNHTMNGNSPGLTGSENTAIGEAAIINNSSGTGNTAAGYYALQTNTSGNDNTAFGRSADVASPSFNNATAVGSYALVGASNSVVLGSISGINSGTADAKVGIGTTTPQQKFNVENGNILLSRTGTNAADTLRMQGTSTGTTSFEAGAQGTTTVDYTLPIAQPTANQVLTATAITGTGPYAVTLGWAAASGNTAWNLTGNTGTTAGTNFLGTIDAQPFEIHVYDGNGSSTAGTGRVFRIEPKSGGGQSANIIGGYHGNSVASGIYGATISGGGFYSGTDYSNIVNANYGTIAGGAGNIVSGNFATISGGVQNKITKDNSLIAGGSANYIGDMTGSSAGVSNVLVGGISDSLSGTEAFLGGGESNTITNSNYYGVLVGGHVNTVTGFGASLLGGQNDSANGGYSAVGGGVYDIADGDMSTVAGGSHNTAAGANSAIPGGFNLKVGTNSFGFNGHITTTDPQTDVTGIPYSAYFGDVNLLLGNVDNTAREMRYYAPNTSFSLAGAKYSSIKAGAQSATINYTLPTAQPTANQVLTATSITGTGPYAVSLGWAAASGNTSWNLTGNGSTSPGTNYLGTSDNQAFEIHVYNDYTGTAVGTGRALRIEPTTSSGSSPNIIGGIAGNGVLSGVVGAVIGGGGASISGNDFYNRVADNDGFVGGGLSNQAGNGTGDLWDGAYATVGGGTQDTAFGIYSVVVGGNQNKAAAEGAAVGGGELNVAAGLYSAIPGGYNLKLGAQSFGFNGSNSAFRADLSSMSGIAYFGNVNVMIGNINDNTARELRFFSPNSSDYTFSNLKYSSFKAGAQSATISYTLPTSQPSTNQVLTAAAITGTGPYAVSLGWAAASGNTAWNLTGNTSTTFGTNFLGTTDSVNLQFRAKNVQSGLIQVSSYSAGNATSNTGFGYGILSANSTGARNTATGYQALTSNTTGLANTANGSRALFSNTTGNANTAFGDWSLYTNTAGNYNTASGQQALYWNTGTENTASGYYSLALNTTGSHNTASGYTTLSSNTTGSYNTGMGYLANVGAPNLTNATALGAWALVGASNSLVIGSIFGVNAATADVNVGIGTTTPLQKFNVENGNILLSRTSTNAADTLRMQGTSTGTSSFVAGAQGTTTVNYTLPTAQPTANQVLSATAITGAGPYAVTLGWAAASGNTAWNLTGNTGTTIGTNYLGTIDNVPFEIHVYNGYGTANQGTGRAFRIEANTGSATSPNLIGGYQENAVNSGAVGATISGGGYHSFANTISADYGVIGGGNKNSVTGVQSVIGGGTSNSIGGINSVISGGERNWAGGTDDVIGGGAGDTIAYLTSAFATANSIVGGFYNYIATGSRFSSIGGGWMNSIAGSYSSIPGGDSLKLGGRSFGVNVPGSAAIPSIIDLSTLTNLAYLGNMDLWLGNTDNTARAIRFYAPSTSTTYSTRAFSSFLAGSQSATINYTLPTAQPSANQVLTATAITGAGPYAVTLGWAAAGSGSAWNLTGNSGTTFGTDFLGTTDNVDLQFRTANVQSGIIQYSSTYANTGFGYGVLASNSTGAQNTANGYLALNSNTSGTQNTALGAQALQANTSGTTNTAVGWGALTSNTIGNINAAFGNGSLLSNISGVENTAIGSQSLLSNTSGTDNAASGYKSLYSSTTGGNNTASGWEALYSNTTGSNNTALGHLADVSSGNLTNAIAIGSNAMVGASNSMVLGSINGVNSAGADVKVGIGTTTPQQKFNVENGNILLSRTSSIPDTLRMQGTSTGTSSFVAGAQGTTTMNYTLPTAQPTANQVLTATAITGAGPYAVTLGWAAPSGSAWNLTGNSGTTDGTSFLGTIDPVPFTIRVHNIQAFRIQPGTITSSFIAGGGDNGIPATASGSFVAAGGYNYAGADYAFNGAGAYDSIATTGTYSSILGGYHNKITNQVSGIVGGEDGYITSDHSFIGGGYTDTVTSFGGFVGGGSHNVVKANDGAVAGGVGNVANLNSFIGGGNSNYAGSSTNSGAAVVGGWNDSSNAAFSDVLGGQYNVTSSTATNSTILGGVNNYITQPNSTIAGGGHLRLTGTNDFAFHAGSTSTDSAIVSANNTAFFGNVNLWLGNTNNTASQLRMYEPQNGGVTFPGASTNFSSFAAGVQSADINYTLPTSQPAANQVLTATAITGAGPYAVTLGWAAAGGSGWNLTGNGSTTPGTNFLGTTDLVAFEIHVNDAGSATGGYKRVMRYEPNSTSANITGGYQGNSITSSMVGSIIAGGGYNGYPNIISTGSMATISGGDSNRIMTVSATGTDYATIGGGHANVIVANASFNSLYSTIAGGRQNKVTGVDDAIAGGERNTIVGAYSAIPGGGDLTLGNFSFGFNNSTDGQLNSFGADLSNTDSIAYFGNVDLWLGSTGGKRTRQLRFFQGNSGTTYSASTYYSAFQAPASYTSGSTVYTLPSAEPTTNQVLSATAITGTGPYAVTLGWADNGSTTGVIYGPTSVQATLTPRTTPLFNVAYIASAANANAAGATITSSAGSAGNFNATGLTIAASGTGTGNTTGLSVSATGSTGTVRAVDATGRVNVDANSSYDLGGNRWLWPGPGASTSVTMIGNTQNSVNSGDHNLFAGSNAGQSNTSGRYNTLVGASAGNAITTQNYNAFFGAGAGLVNTGDNNSFFGGNSGSTNTTGTNNAFFGLNAGSANTTANANAFFGCSAGQSATTGGFNTAIGLGANNANTTGLYNAAMGAYAGYSAITASWNVFVGESAGRFVTSADNVIVGGYAGGGATSGGANTYIGRDAGTTNITGSNQTIVGYEAQPLSSGLTNASAIGSYAAVNTSNALVLGSINGVNGASADTKVGIGTTAPSHPLHSVNSATTDEMAAVYGVATNTTTNQAIGVWGDASNTSTTNTGTIGVLATGNGNTTTTQTNAALQINDGEFTMGRTSEAPGTGTDVEPATGGTAYSAQGPSGVVEFTLGATGNLATSAPSAGAVQNLGSVTINNRYCQVGSIVLVNVVNFTDDGVAPDPRDAGFIVNADNTTSGSFSVRIKMLPTVTSASNYTTSDKIRIGYMIVNKSR